MEQLTTTSYLILGLLTSRDWSAYGLAEQLGRGVTEIWPRANRGLYSAPKKLVEHGLATSTTLHDGRRTRTMYSITPAGLAALKDWLREPPHPSALQFEGMLRVLFADHGSIEDLRENLATMAAQAEETRDLFVERARQMLDADTRLQPERLHLMALANRFMVEHFCTIAEWARWALDACATWNDTTSPARTDPPGIQAVLEETIRLGEASARATARRA